MSNSSVDEERMFDFHLLMLMECHSCCIYRELFGLSRSALAAGLGKCTSLIRKLEVGELADGHDEKDAYMRYFRLGILFVSNINNSSLQFYETSKYSLIRNNKALRLAEFPQATDNPELLSLAKDIEKYAKRLAVLFCIAAHFGLDTAAMEKHFFECRGMAVGKDVHKWQDSFNASIDSCQEIPLALKKEQLRRIWAIADAYTKKLNKKNKAFKALEKQLEDSSVE